MAASLSMKQRLLFVMIVLHVKRTTAQYPMGCPLMAGPPPMRFAMPLPQPPPQMQPMFITMPRPTVPQMPTMVINMALPQQMGGYPGTPAPLPYPLPPPPAVLPPPFGVLAPPVMQYPWQRPHISCHPRKRVIRIQRKRKCGRRSCGSDSSSSSSSSE